MKKENIAFCALIFTMVCGCVKKDPHFTMGENQVGALSFDSKVTELEALFANDSVVRDTLSTPLGNSKGKISIYEKGGKPLLQLTPNTDSIPTIEMVQVLDNRFTSDKGISLKSSFKDILRAYPNCKVVTTVNSVVVFPKGSNLYFTIDKEELPASLRYNNQKVEAVQVPDEAKIKYLMLSWH